MRDEAELANGLMLQHAQITGIGGRDNNEDALACETAGQFSCFVVSDGVGGHEGGEIASKLVADTIIESFVAMPALDNVALKSHVNHAVTKIEQCKEQHERLRDMSATVVALGIDRHLRRAAWAHLGDSRLYLFRNARQHCVTKDHSVAQQLVEAGFCTVEQLAIHPLRNHLFAAVGGDREMVDELAQDSVDLQDGDAFLLCTDGFWEWIAKSEMEQTLAAAKSAAHWLESMAQIAARNSSLSGKPRDNYTAFAIMVADAGRVIHFLQPQ